MRSAAQRRLPLGLNNGGYGYGGNNFGNYYGGMGQYGSGYGQSGYGDYGEAYLDYFGAGQYGNQFGNQFGNRYTNNGIGLSYNQCLRNCQMRRSRNCYNLCRSYG